MMLPFIQNPRRGPRNPFRCVARVATAQGGHWLTITRDLSPGGCQLEAPGPVEPGTQVDVQLADERCPPFLAVTGAIAWCTVEAPWRAGIAFDDASVPAATRFFEALAVGRPTLCAVANAPEKLPAIAILAPVPPPAASELPALTADEARVLRALGEGRCAGPLVEELGLESSVAALFALLARRYVAVGAPNREAARRWAPVLERFA